MKQFYILPLDVKEKENRILIICMFDKIMSGGKKIYFPNNQPQKSAIIIHQCSGLLKYN